MWFLIATLVAIAVGCLVIPPSNVRELTFERWPSLFSLYYQAGVSVVRKMFTGKTDFAAEKQKPCLAVSLVRPQQMDRLVKLKQLCKYPADMKAAVPLMYPICESFRLNIQTLLLPAFPFSVLRTVLKSISTTMYRDICAEEALVWRVEINPNSFTQTEKGHIEVDMVSMASSAVDKSVVWRSTVRAVVLNPSAPKGGGPAPAPLDESAFEVIDTWRHDGSVGRRYGALNGDLNPIHLHSSLSKLFGFKRPIAHALFQLSCTEASLRKQGVSFSYPRQMDVECKRPTLLPATLHCALDKRVPAEGGAVHFAVLTQDKAKEVLVGKLFTPKSC